MLVRLWEADNFTFVPDDVGEDCQHYGESFFSTLACELTSNGLRDRSRHDKGNKMTPQTAWHRMAIKKVLLNDCGRNCVSTTSASQSYSKTLPPKIPYQADKKYECSLGDSLNFLSLEPAPWANPNPENSKNPKINP